MLNENKQKLFLRIMISFVNLIIITNRLWEFGVPDEIIMTSSHLFKQCQDRTTNKATRKTNLESVRDKNDGITFIQFSSN